MEVVMVSKYDEFEKIKPDVDKLKAELEEREKEKKSLNSVNAVFSFKSDSREEKIGETKTEAVFIKDIKTYDAELSQIFLNELREKIESKISEIKKKIDDLKQKCE